MTGQFPFFAFCTRSVQRSVHQQTPWISTSRDLRHFRQKNVMRVTPVRIGIVAREESSYPHCVQIFLNCTVVPSWLVIFAPLSAVARPCLAGFFFTLAGFVGVGFSCDELSWAAPMTSGSCSWKTSGGAKGTSTSAARDAATAGWLADAARSLLGGRGAGREKRFL